MSTLTAAPLTREEWASESLVWFERAADQTGTLRKNENVFERRVRLETARCAVRSLTAELRLFPKPGLVSLVDSGSHLDMDGATFMRSIFALRHYFARITQAGMRGRCFESLKRLGMEAEVGMLHATGGVNTHRGAIFCLGLLCAAIGRCSVEYGKVTADLIRQALLQHWGEALMRHRCDASGDSHGAIVSRSYAVAGARREAALGMPSVFELGLPMLELRLREGGSLENACIDVFFQLMASIDDTNVYHRGGLHGASLVRQRARKFVDQGGTAHPDWREDALSCHRLFMQHRLSPGGAADLLAATCLVFAVTRNPFMAQASSTKAGVP